MAEWRVRGEDVVLRTPWFEVSLAAVELTERLDWIPLRDVPTLIAAGQIRTSSTAVALLYLQAAPPRDQ